MCRLRSRSCVREPLNDRVQETGHRVGVALRHAVARVAKQVPNGAGVGAGHAEARREGMAQVLPTELADAGTLERGSEHEAVELAPVERACVSAFGNTHSHVSREGSARRAASNVSLIGTTTGTAPSRRPFRRSALIVRGCELASQVPDLLPLGRALAP